MSQFIALAQDLGLADSEYASAIRKGAPQARQVSDRGHLVKNLAECVSVQLAKTLAQLRRAEATTRHTSQSECLEVVTTKPN